METNPCGQALCHGNIRTALVRVLLVEPASARHISEMRTAISPVRTTPKSRIYESPMIKHPPRQGCRVALGPVRDSLSPHLRPICKIGVTVYLARSEDGRKPGGKLLLPLKAACETFPPNASGRIPRCWGCANSPEIIHLTAYAP
jgi:hypothetical protein